MPVMPTTESVNGSIPQWTYSGDPTSSHVDTVRFWLQDTDPAMPLLGDMEIQFLVDEWLPKYDTLIYVAAVAADRVSAKFAGVVSVTADGVSVNVADLSDRYAALAARLRQTHKDAQVGAEVDISNLMWGQHHDMSIDPLEFGVSMHDNREAGRQDYGSHRTGVYEDTVRPVADLLSAMIRASKQVADPRAASYASGNRAYEVVLERPHTVPTFDRATNTWANEADEVLYDGPARITNGAGGGEIELGGESTSLTSARISIDQLPGGLNPRKEDLVRVKTTPLSTATGLAERLFVVDDVEVGGHFDIGHVLSVLGAAPDPAHMIRGVSGAVDALHARTRVVLPTVQPAVPAVQEIARRAATAAVLRGLSPRVSVRMNGPSIAVDVAGRGATATRQAIVEDLARRMPMIQQAVRADAIRKLGGVAVAQDLPERGVITDALVTHLRGHAELEPAGVLVGDGLPPDAAGWPGGSPNNGAFVASVTVETQPGQPRDRDTLNARHTSWTLQYGLRSIGAARTQADNAADRARAAVLAFKDVVLPIGWAVQDVVLAGLAPVVPNKGTDPPTWEVGDTFQVWVTRKRS